jgi:hypothetical protein
MVADRQPKSVECFKFTWRRPGPGSGFRWEQDRRHGWLLVGPPQDSWPEYEPLVRETGLFLTFARLDGSPDGFLRFANTYGRLGTYHTLGLERGEPLYEWQPHHRWMRFLTDLHDACMRDRSALGKVVSWQGGDVLYRFPEIGAGAGETWRHRGQLLRCPRGKDGLPLFRPGDLRGPALWFLAYALDDWLTKLGALGRPVAARVVWSEERRRPQFVFGPGSLLGAMVCQFAAALHGAWPFQECANCHKFFRLEPGVNRANRLTCSHTCKQYLYNRRVKRAQELRAEGRTIPQIVRDLRVQPRGGKSALAIVRGWVARR